jgi:hypothetical protein
MSGSSEAADVYDAVRTPFSLEELRLRTNLDLRLHDA